MPSVVGEVACGGQLKTNMSLVKLDYTRDISSMFNLILIRLFPGCEPASRQV